LNSKKFIDSKFQKLDDNILKALWDLGVFGLQVPAEYGGLDLNSSQYGQMAEIFGKHDLGVNTVIFAHQSIGYKVNYRKKTNIQSNICLKERQMFVIGDVSKCT
jgi:alkylation response protein AidB-like acyl-CoA dehydrogenase